MGLLPKVDRVYKIFLLHTSCCKFYKIYDNTMEIMYLYEKKTHFADLSRKMYDRQSINVVLQLFDITVTSESTGH